MKTRGPYIFKRSGSWVMRFREVVNDAGQLRTVQRAKPLCPASLAKSEARSLAKTEMEKLEAGRPAKPEMVVTLADFVASVYLPFTVTNKRKSTADGYRDAWASHFAGRPNIARKLLKDVHTSDVYAWLSEIAETDRTKHRAPLRKRTLQHLKTFLSGVFTHAKNFGYFDGPNPVTGCIVPQGADSAETYAHSLEEISAMLAVLPEPARTMVATAAFTGLRRGELRGLLWDGYSADELRVMRSIVDGKLEDPKTPSSKSAVPLLASLSRVLASHRERDGNPQTGPIFRTSIGTSLDPNNVLGRQILPALKVAGIRWHGWHAFRRGLATNLNRLHVPDKTIQAILRHANVATTQTYYIKPVAEDSVSAMAALDAVLCSTCALDSVVTADVKVQ
jgi:integrase